MHSLEKGSIVAGRYRLDRELARGGMGCVWIGRHLGLDVDVAIKFMTPQLAESPSARTRFEREAKASANLKTAHAVHVYDYGVENDWPFMVMELLEGEDLDARLSRVGRFDHATTLEVLEQACRAIRCAHEIGLVHRDLKPANLYLAHNGGHELVKVLDFGIVKPTGDLLAGRVTRTGAILGSPQYMSPEQVRNSQLVDHRTDLWALGVIAFQCLTGHLLFTGDEIGQIFVDICTKPLPSAAMLGSGLGPAGDRFFDRALARKPEDRFQTTTEFVEAFAALAGSAVAGASVPAASSSGPSGMPMTTTLPESGYTQYPSTSAPPPRPRASKAVFALSLSTLVGVLAIGSFVVVRAAGARSASQTFDRDGAAFPVTGAASELVAPTVDAPIAMPSSETKELPPANAQPPELAPRPAPATSSAPPAAPRASSAVGGPPAATSSGPKSTRARDLTASPPSSSSPAERAPAGSASPGTPASSAAPARKGNDLLKYM